MKIKSICDIKAALFQLSNGNSEIYDKYIANCLKNPRIKRLPSIWGNKDLYKKNKYVIIKWIIKSNNNMTAKLSGTFDWSMTPEGSNYWSSINMRLEKIENEITKRKTAKRKEMINTAFDAIQKEVHNIH
jgi:hypothetical protein